MSRTSRCGFGNPSNHLRASVVEDERTPLLRSSVTSASVVSKNFAKSTTESIDDPAEVLVPLLISDFDSAEVVVVLPLVVLVAFFLPAFFFPTISQPVATEQKDRSNN